LSSAVCEQLHAPKHKLNGGGSEATKTAKYLQAISTALTAYDPRLASAWEGKDISVNIDDFTQHVYSEAAEDSTSRRASTLFVFGVWFSQLLFLLRFL
jgi:hypothetical protein